MQKKLQIFIKILIAATFFVPLIVLPSSYIFPFIVPKIVWFRALTMLMLGGYILLLASNWQEYKIKLTPINIAIGLFFVSFAVSTFVGVDWYKSFWDNHERMLGLFTIFHFVIYSYIVSSVIKDKKDWLWLLRLFLGAGSLVMLIGFLQKYINPQMLLNQGSDRVSATLGNSIYFSGYGLFLFFIGLLLFLQEKETSFWKYYAAAGGLLGFLGIFWGGTRGTVLGIAVGFLVLCLSYLITLKQYPKVRKIVGIILIVGLLAGGMIFVFRKNELVQKLPGVSRLVDTDFTISGSKIPRVMAWGIAWQAFVEKPIFGWGPNNFYYAFNKYYRPEFLESGWGETWFDNAHNIVMNTLAVQGGVGIVIYFGLFGTAIYSLWRGYKKGTANVHLVSIGTAFLVAHFVNNITVFENPTSYLYFFFFLAFINSQIIDHRSLITDKKVIIKDKDISIGLTVVTSLVVLLLIYSTDINTARANEATLTAIRQLYTNPDLAITAYQTAANIPSPHIDDIRNDFTRTVAQAIPQLAQDKKTEVANKLLDLSFTELEKNRLLHPLDIRVHLAQAQLDFQAVQMKNDGRYLLEAEQTLNTALLLSPKRQQIQFMFAPLELQLGKTDMAIKLMQDALNNDSLISESWWRLALTFKQAGKDQLAKDTITKALAQGIVFDGQGKQIEDLIMATATKGVKIK